MKTTAAFLFTAITICAPTASAQEAYDHNSINQDAVLPGDEMVSDPADPEIDANYPSLSHFAWKTNAAAAIRRMYDSAVGGFEGDMSFGSEGRRGAYYGSLRFFAGRTEGGLTVGQFSFGPTLEWPLDVVRLGLKPRFGYLWIDRVTADSAMDALTVGVSAVVSADVYRSEGLAVAVGVEPVVEGLFSFFELFDDQGTTGMFGANGFVSFRLRAPRETRPSVASSSF